MGRSHVYQAGNTEQRLWLRATVVNTLPHPARFLWVLHAFVDSATLYMQPVGRGPLRPVGRLSAWQVAHRRPLPLRSPALPFWLAAHETAVLYLRVENDAGEYYLPSHIDGFDAWLSHEFDLLFSSWWPLLVSFFLSSVLLNFVLYAWMRDPIHLWYGAYVLLASWFLYMEDMLDAGILAQPLYTLGWGLGQYGVLLLSLACGLRVLVLFVRLRQGWPLLYRASTLALWAALAVALVGLGLRLASQGHPASPALILTNRLRDGLLWGLLLLEITMLTVVWARGPRPQRRLARLYAATYGLYFLGDLNMLANHTGRVNIHVVAPNLMAWGLALEILTLSILLAGRFRYAQQQVAAARQRRLHERAAAGQRLIAAQDEEREELARELHDALAPGLTALHLAWQGRQVRQALGQAPAVLAEAHQHTEALLRQLRHDVRSLGRVLLPAPPGEPLTLPAVALLTETLSLTDDGPEVRCECDPVAAHLPAALQAAAYRLVAELLHNALRHAQAQGVRVQVRRLAGVLLLLVEDDGRGFNVAQVLNTPGAGGLGLRGVRARVGYLRGQLHVRSQPGQGTAVRVELPLD